jgi:hypothetical protein
MIILHKYYVFVGLSYDVGSKNIDEGIKTTDLQWLGGENVDYRIIQIHNV